MCNDNHSNSSQSSTTTLLKYEDVSKIKQQGDTAGSAKFIVDLTSTAYEMKLSAID
jgi:hypothetical protein